MDFSFISLTDFTFIFLNISDGYLYFSRWSLFTYLFIKQYVYCFPPSGRNISKICTHRQDSKLLLVGKPSFDLTCADITATKKAPEQTNTE